jgi:hypothetical protein
VKLFIQMKSVGTNAEESDDYSSYSCPNRNTVDEVALSIINTILENKQRLVAGTEITIGVSEI